MNTASDSHSEPTRQRSRRTAIVATTLATVLAGGLAAGFTAGLVVGSHGGASGDRPRGTEASGLRLANAHLRTPQSCDDLLRWYVDRGVERVTPYGWDFPVYYLEGDAGGDAGGLPSAAVPAPMPGEATSSATGTNVRRPASTRRT
ncbi:MAG: hypothetical protein R2734_21270 [Nocardioides sp.]